MSAIVKLTVKSLASVAVTSAHSATWWKVWDRVGQLCSSPAGLTQVLKVKFTSPRQQLVVVLQLHAAAQGNQGVPDSLA